ncbi:hypothetical protein Hanom_Chr11g00983711 [Helianthus anomalus]
MQQTTHVEIEKTTTTGGFANEEHEEGHLETLDVEGESAGGQVRVVKRIATKNSNKGYLPICADDTLGDIYYKTYDESRTNEIHAPVWKVRHGDIFYEFGPYREWCKGAFTPGQVRHQRDRGHDHLYRSHVCAHANYASTSYQINRKWRTMYLEHASWEKHRERLASQII